MCSATEMLSSQYHNVYSGPRALQEYFDPDKQPMLPLVELPPKLNPFLEDGVHIFAKMLTALPAQNVKALPALNMLQNAFDSESKPVVEASSGSTVISLSLVSRVMNQNDDVTAYVSNKTEMSRLRTLSFFGLKLSLYGGPSQPEISDERGIINKIKRWAEEDGNVFAPCQYENENNYRSHMRWTGPQLLKQLPNISIFCAGMGSAGCVTGTGLYLKEHNPYVKIIGVCNQPEDPVPGPRPASLFETISFPWKMVVDKVEVVDSLQSYRMSMQLSREGLICGPSSGMALQALLNFLHRVKDEGRLTEYVGPDGQVSAVFPCCDLPYQYMDNYFKKLDSSHFHPINNSHLLNIDTCPYNHAWELEAPAAIYLLHSGGKLTIDGKHLSEVEVIDIRAPNAFRSGTLPGARNVPFDSVTASTPSPFDDVSVLESQWNEMKARVGQDLKSEFIGQGSKVISFCYNGESARMLTSILRAQGIEAYSIKGGDAFLAELS
ncbi:tryptophan synthase beta subunit-like PLP-dependent enzyme [Hypomontagnella submonticulosa]|nr:tryptophan synthase beta subunit-like PLP-dependent enzyme [Hypomontagnella submonticulosa]